MESGFYKKYSFLNSIVENQNGKSATMADGGGINGEIYNVAPGHLLVVILAWKQKGTQLGMRGI